MTTARRHHFITLLAMLTVMVGLLIAFPTLAFAADDLHPDPIVQIDVLKVLETTQAGIWPSSVDTMPFNFKLTPVGYTNGPAETGTGTPFTNYTASNLPMPGTGFTPDNNGGDDDIVVKNFLSSVTGTSQQRDSLYDPITYTQKGVYTYKVTETTTAGSKVPGVIYDTDEYFVNVYVENIVDNDNVPVLKSTGAPYVTVTGITVFRNDNVIADKDGNGQGDGTPMNPDVGGDGKVHITDPDNPDNPYVEDDGDEDPDDPHEIVTDALVVQVKLINKYNVAALKISKQVKGGQADVSKLFDFEIKLEKGTGGADLGTYHYEIYNDGTPATLASSGLTSSSGTTSPIKLKHNQYVIVYAPYDDKVTVTEDNTSATGYTTDIIGIHGNANPTISDEDTNRTLGQQTISSAGTGTNTQSFVNTKETITPTGAWLNILPYALIAALAASGLAIWLLSRRRRRVQPQRSNGGL